MTLHLTFYCQFILAFYATGVKKNSVVSTEDHAGNRRRKNASRERNASREGIPSATRNF